ncbi:MAG: hypothetical protein ACP5US_03655 [Candidatus Kryptoniota bacterium]
MSKYAIIAWILPFIFMLVSFYFLFQSEASIAVKVVFTVMPILIWILGGVAIYREYRSELEIRKKQDEIIKEVKKILQSNQHSEESRGRHTK